MPSHYIVLEKKTPNLDVHVTRKALARQSESLEGLPETIPPGV
jgi:hypothetical protein